MTQAPITFGTDGWRGLIADDFTFGNLRRVAAAAAALFARQPTDRRRPVLIGYDRRFLSREFAHAVAAVLAQHGIAVEIGREPMPTPAVSVCLASRKAEWGVMITASHNPALYNGFKVKQSPGRSASPDVTRQIETLLPDTAVPVAPAADLPTFDYRPDYLAYLKDRLDWSVLKRCRAGVVLDHFYGVSAGIPELLLKPTRLRVYPLHAEADPLFGGLHPEPIPEYLGDLQKEVRRRRALLGLAFDGDADRLGVVDDRGQCLSPHQVFPLLALYAVEQKGWTGKIVQAVSLGALGERIAKAFGLPFEEVPVGFKHVADRMVREEILAGGEESGGYGFHGGLPERDGILSGLLFLEMVARSGRKPSELLRAMEKRFGRARFRRKDIALSGSITDKQAFVQKALQRLPDQLAGETVVERRTLDGLKIVLASGAWLLLRPSGTEPLLRTYAESDRWGTTDRLLRWAAENAEPILTSTGGPS